MNEDNNIRAEADTGFSERGGVACPMSGCLTSGHFPGGRLAFFFLSFFGGVGVGGRTISG